MRARLVVAPWWVRTVVVAAAVAPVLVTIGIASIRFTGSRRPVPWPASLWVGVAVGYRSPSGPWLVAVILGGLSAVVGHRSVVGLAAPALLAVSAGWTVTQPRRLARRAAVLRADWPAAPAPRP